MSAAATSHVVLTDTSLRDGSHAVGHQFVEQQVAAVVAGLDAAGVPIIEVSHGDGLAGSTYNYGFSRTDELLLLRAAVGAASRSTIAVLLVPGIGTSEDLLRAAEAGARMVRIATHSTEADVSIQHFATARELGLATVGFLMLSHMTSPTELAGQARIMVDAGCECVYVVDSAGALVLDDVARRVDALVDEIGSAAEVGFHAHDNLGLAVANSVVAQRAGATRIDGSTRGLGAGAGNAATELLVAVFARLGVSTGVDLPAALTVAEEIVAPLMARPLVRDRGAIMLGYAGAYSSFLLHAERAGERYGVPVHEILEEAGRRGLVGGQEDMIIDIAVQLSEHGIEGVAEVR